MQNSFSIDAFRLAQQGQKDVYRQQMALLLEEVAAVEALDFAALENEVWAQVNCLTCAGCCRYMGPQLNAQDQQRIASHLRLRKADFARLYLQPAARGEDPFLRQRPCMFLHPSTHLCAVYEIRPSACAAFPHLGKKPFAAVAQMHLVNRMACPATHTFLTLIEDAVLAQNSAPPGE